ncbi:MAG: hypothetical protein ABL982_23340, partial [Vicinamibacterales bacterium]
GSIRGEGWATLGTIGATGTGVGGATASVFTGAGAGAGGGMRGTSGNGAGGVAKTVVGITNAAIERAGGVSEAFGAPMVTTTTAPARSVWNATLSPRPVVDRPAGRVVERPSSNKIDIGYTELACRSVLLRP